MEESTDGSNFTNLVTSAANTTNYKVTNLQPNTQYWFRVAAENDAGAGTSATITATTKQNVTLDGNGWTTILPSTDTQIIYVSSSTGSDSNDGLSANTPVKTIAHAESMITTAWTGSSSNPIWNHSVWILLRAGDTFHESFGGWKWGGTSATSPSMISSYGNGARPIVATGTDSGIYLQGGGGTPASLSYVAITGINFYADGRDPNSPTYVGTTSDPGGLTDLLGGQNLLIENCEFQFYKDNIVEEGGRSNFTLRRSIVANSYSVDAHSQGLYMYALLILLLEDNLFDHNGWIGTDRNATSYVGSFGTVTGGGRDNVQP